MTTARAGRKHPDAGAMRGFGVLQGCVRLVFSVRRETAQVLRGTFRMKRIACLVALVAVASVISVPAASAKDADHHSRHHNDERHHRGDGDHRIGSVEVVIDGLNNPRQIAVRGSSVYVAEAGTGGNTCFDVA